VHAALPLSDPPSARLVLALKCVRLVMTVLQRGSAEARLHAMDILTKISGACDDWTAGVEVDDVLRSPRAPLRRGPHTAQLPRARRAPGRRGASSHQGCGGQLRARPRRRRASPAAPQAPVQVPRGPPRLRGARPWPRRCCACRSWPPSSPSRCCGSSPWWRPRRRSWKTW
jgi:hypothetical protein